MITSANGRILGLFLGQYGTSLHTGGLRFSHPRVFPTTGPVCDGLRPSFFHFYPTFPDVIPSFDMFFSIPVTKEKHGETPERAPRECHGKCPEVRNEREAPGVVGQGRSCG